MLDSLSEIRLLAQSSLRYRRQILALKHYFARHGATVLLLDDLTADTLDKTVHSVAARRHPAGGDVARLRRRAAARRGSSNIAPRASAAATTTSSSGAAARRSSRGWSRPSTASDFKRGRIGTGIAGLDTLLGGGVEHGSSTLLMGPAGAGKSLITLQFVAQAIRDGGKAAMFIFDEELGLLFDRAKPLGFDLAGHADAGELCHHPARRGGAVARANSPTASATASQDRQSRPSSSTASTATRRRCRRRTR